MGENTKVSEGAQPGALIGIDAWRDTSATAEEIVYAYQSQPPEVATAVAEDDVEQSAQPAARHAAWSLNAPILGSTVDEGAVARHALRSTLSKPLLEMAPPLILVGGVTYLLYEYGDRLAGPELDLSKSLGQPHPVRAGKVTVAQPVPDGKVPDANIKQLCVSSNPDPGQPQRYGTVRPAAADMPQAFFPEGPGSASESGGSPGSRSGFISRGPSDAWAQRLHAELAEPRRLLDEAIQRRPREIAAEQAWIAELEDELDRSRAGLPYDNHEQLEQQLSDARATLQSPLSEQYAYIKKAREAILMNHVAFPELAAVADQISLAAVRPDSVAARGVQMAQARYDRSTAPSQSPLKIALHRALDESYVHLRREVDRAVQEIDEALYRLSPNLFDRPNVGAKAAVARLMPQMDAVVARELQWRRAHSIDVDPLREPVPEQLWYTRLMVQAMRADPMWQDTVQLHDAENALALLDGDHELHEHYRSEGLRHLRAELQAAEGRLQDAARAEEAGTGSDVAVLRAQRAVYAAAEYYRETARAYFTAARAIFERVATGVEPGMADRVYAGHPALLPRMWRAPQTP